MDGSEPRRICIPLPYRRQGGMYTFLANFMTYMDRSGVPYTQDIEGDYQILFVNSWAVPYRSIRAQKAARQGLRVVQRVDGSGRDYGRFDDADSRQARVNMLADLTIFQSRYSKYSSREKFKVIQQDGPVIYNPVDHEIFRPDARTIPIGGAIRVCNASFSTNRNKGTWRIAELARRNPKVTFVLCGLYPPLPDLPNISQLGHLDREELARAIRSCDVFLHLAENDPCPNVVTEALASGLPVLYRDSGGTPELVGQCGMAVTDETFGDSLALVLERRPGLSRAARQRALECFSPDNLFTQYLDVMTSGRRRQLPSRLDLLRAALAGYPVAPGLREMARRLTGGWAAG